jgi:hypothetical protein
MPTPLISGGPWVTIAQNVIYALPSRQVYIQSNVAIESSIDGTTFTALTGANTTGVLTSATFIRSTLGPANIVAKYA